MKFFRRIAIIIVLYILCSCLLFSLFGCAPKMREDGYFTYYIRKEKDGVKYVHISELTELGKQQKTLVIPEEIGGKKVVALEKWKFDMWSPDLIWESEIVEKIVFTTDNIYIDGRIFGKCVNLRKIIIILCDIEYPTSLNNGINKICYQTSDNTFVYIPKTAFNLYIMQLATDRGISEEEALESAYKNIRLKPANVSFYFNYDININYGCYWADDVNYGEKIEFIPSNPVRESYEFGGWYKEAECINKWVFETDILPEEIFDEAGNNIYQETKLYAKWVIKQ